MFRLYRITKNSDGIDNPQRDDFEDVTISEGNFEFQKGLAMENKSLAFLMLLDNTGQIHNGYIDMIGEGTIKPRLFEVKTKDKETLKTYPHESSDEVSADFYKRLGGAKQDETVRAIMLRGIGAHGEQLEYAYWVRPVEIPEEEPTPEEPEE